MRSATVEPNVAAIPAQNRPPVSTTLENEAMTTREDEATQTDGMGDLSIGLASDSAAGRGPCSAASGRTGSKDRQVNGREGVGLGPATEVRAGGAAVPTAFTLFEPLVRQLLITAPDMPATVTAERVRWTGADHLVPRQDPPAATGAPPGVRASGQVAHAEKRTKIERAAFNGISIRLPLARTRMETASAVVLEAVASISVPGRIPVTASTDSVSTSL